MFTIRTLSRKSRLLSTCKEPAKKYKMVQLIILGLAALPAAPIVKYQYDKFVYNREMVKYEEQMVLYRERREQAKDSVLFTMSAIPQKPEPPVFISLLE
jgi:hypothetical protein